MTKQEPKPHRDKQPSETEIHIHLGPLPTGSSGKTPSKIPDPMPGLPGHPVFKIVVAVATIATALAQLFGWSWLGG